MKKSLFTFLSILLFTTTIMASGFNYQAVVRNNAGEAIPNNDVSFKFSILKTTVSGSVVYSETHNTTTNDFGLVTLTIGNGTSAENINDIKWFNDDYFLKVEVDIEGGSDFSDMGTTQILSVPLANHAKTSSSLMVFTNTEKDALEPEIGTIIYNSDTRKIEAYIEVSGEPTVDQSFTVERNSSSQFNNSFPNAGQSFTSDVTGKLTGVDVDIFTINTGGNIIFTIHEGTGFNGAVIGTINKTLAVSDAGIIHFDLSNENIMLTAGQVYTWKVSIPDGSTMSGSISRTTGNLYSGGSEIVSHGGGAGCCDRYFVTYMAAQGLQWVDVK